MILRKLKHLSFICLAACLIGCGADNAAGSNAKSQRQAMPQDPEIKALYLQSCYSCHANAINGAPLSGDAEAWAARRSKGLDSLVNNAILGVGGMPPLGLCSDCTEDDFIGLVKFMAVIE